MQIGAPPLPRDEAAKAMAELLRHEIGLEVTPQQIIRLIESRWATLSQLAHAIHRKASNVQEMRSR